MQQQISVVHTLRTRYNCAENNGKNKGHTIIIYDENAIYRMYSFLPSLATQKRHRESTQVNISEEKPAGKIPLGMNQPWWKHYFKDVKQISDVSFQREASHCYSQTNICIPITYKLHRSISLKENRALECLKQFLIELKSFQSISWKSIPHPSCPEIVYVLAVENHLQSRQINLTQWWSVCDTKTTDATMSGNSDENSWIATSIGDESSEFQRFRLLCCFANMWAEMSIVFAMVF